MQRGGKIAVASAVLLTGIVAAIVFRKSPDQAGRAGAGAETTSPSVRTEADQPAAGVGRLLGRIDQVPASAGDPSSVGGSSLSTGSAERALDPSDPPPSLASSYSESDDSAPLPGQHGREAIEHRTGASPDGQTGRSVAARHIIRDGDTLAALAQRYLGASERAWEIFEINRDKLLSADLLPIGLELELPPASTPPGKSVGDSRQRDMVPIPPGSLSRRRPSP